MDEATLKRATEPFFTSKGVGKGTGLGLSMVQGMAEQSGGRLTLESGVGEGTRAHLCLPAVSPSRLEATLTTESPKVTVAMPKSLSVMVVDDDALVLANTADMLEDLGHRVTSVTSGAAALEEMKARSFNLLITDHAMPAMTGAQLIRQVRSSYPSMAIIIASGFAEMPDDVGSITRLNKPYSQADLSVAISKTSASVQR